MKKNIDKQKAEIARLKEVNVAMANQLAAVSSYETRRQAEIQAAKERGVASEVQPHEVQNLVNAVFCNAQATLSNAHALVNASSVLLARENAFDQYRRYGV